MGGGGKGKDWVLDLWGADPVHPTKSVYKVIAERVASILEEIDIAAA